MGKVTNFWWNKEDPNARMTLQYRVPSIAWLTKLAAFPLEEKRTQNDLCKFMIV